MRSVILAGLSTVVALVLLLSFKTHSTTSLATPPAAVASSAPSAAATSAAAPSAAASTFGSASSSAAAPTTSAKPSPTKTATSTAKKTVVGDSEDTRYGPVQVQITVVSGKVTAVTAVDYPQQDPRDAQINAYAIPVLDKEALAAGTAKIDMVSGATYTSVGYVNSLQSALDKAGL